MSQPTTLLTLEEAAKLLRYKNAHSLWRYLNKPGGIPTINLSGKRRLVDARDLDAFISRRRAGN